MIIFLNTWIKISEVLLWEMCMKVFMITINHQDEVVYLEDNYLKFYPSDINQEHTMADTELSP